jgi:hypothetical protein
MSPKNKFCAFVLFVKLTTTKNNAGYTQYSSVVFQVHKDARAAILICDNRPKIIVIYPTALWQLLRPWHASFLPLAVLGTVRDNPLGRSIHVYVVM